jgi:hypothetical protein
MGSTARFAPGSLAQRQPTNQESDKEVEVIHMDVGAAVGTPRASGAPKCKSADEVNGSASKVRPR